MKIALVTSLLLISVTLLADITAEEVIEKMEQRQEFKSAFIQGRMVINDRFGEKISTFDSWSLGTDNSLIAFTSLEEQGQKVLRSDNDIYIYYPDAEELIRLSGSALRDGMLGSDVSYEDMTGEKSLLNDYRVTAFSQEPLGKHSTYKIELQALRSSVAYPKQILWIDIDTLNGIQAHKFSLSGKLIKVERVLEMITQGDHTFAIHSKVEDKLKSNSSTEFFIDHIEIDYPVTLDFFSLDELTW